METSFEKEFLSYLLYEPKRIDYALDLVAPEYFQDYEGKVIYSAMRKLSDDGGDLTRASISEQCKKMDQERLWTSILFSLSEEVLTVDLKYTAEKIVDAWKKKKLYHAIEKANIGFREHLESDEILSELEDALDEIGNNNDRECDGEIDTALVDLLTEFTQRLELTGLIGIDTGYTAINDITYGLQRGNIAIVAGRPSMGKTCFAVNVMVNAASKGYKCAMFSIEMGKKAVLYRIAASLGNLELGKLIDAKSTTKKERDKFNEVLSDIAKLPMVIYDRTYTVQSIKRQIRKLKRTKGIDLVVVDYLQHIRYPNKRPLREEVANASREFKELAKDLDIAVVLVSQLNRNVESRTDKRPMLSDMAESGNIEQDADLIMLMYSEHYYDKKAPEDSCEVNVAKNRQGQTDTVDLKWDRGKQKFKNRGY